MEHTPTALTDVAQKEPLSTDSDYDTWFRQQVEDGLADMEAGRSTSGEEMMSFIEAQNRRMDAARNP